MKIIRYHKPATNGLGDSACYTGRNPLVAFEREFAQLFQTALKDMFAHAPDLGGVSGNRFAVDLYEDKDNNYVRAELPGVARKDINVEVVDDYLTISGSRAIFTAEGKLGDPVVFSRSIVIPDNVQGDRVAASYENGILTVTLPKREEAKPRRVSVEVKDAS
jgi:HSP20 family protein